jgi:hypothetical protein
MINLFSVVVGVSNVDGRDEAKNASIGNDKRWTNIDDRCFTELD